MQKNPMNDPKAALLAAPCPATTDSQRPDRLAPPTVRAPKFGTASEGWEAYNSWLDRVRQQPAPPSRQAVIAKALYSVSSYKSWADKARGAFDKK
jgi:hypothetical protein